MDTKSENKIVRDARGQARRCAKKGGGTYQQCLDAVAQERGHPHWKAFKEAHPDQISSRIDEVPIAHDDARTGTQIANDAWMRVYATSPSSIRERERTEAIISQAERRFQENGQPVWGLWTGDAGRLLMALFLFNGVKGWIDAGADGAGVGLLQSLMLVVCSSAFAFLMGIMGGRPVTPWFRSLTRRMTWVAYPLILAMTILDIHRGNAMSWTAMLELLLFAPVPYLYSLMLVKVMIVGEMKSPFQEIPESILAGETNRRASFNQT